MPDTVPEPTPPATLIRYTSRVRRGFQMLLNQGLEENVNTLLANSEKLPRGRRLNTSQVADLRACLAYMRQEAEGGEE